MLGFDADTPSDFFLKLGKVVFYALATGFGVYLLSMFSGWLLFPFAPKQEDFSSEKDRVEFYNLGSWDLVLFMFLIIGVTLVFSGFIK